MSRNDFYQELKEKRAEQLFWREFDHELSRILAEKKEGVNQDEFFDSEINKEISTYKRPKTFVIENDDKHHTKLWDSMIKDTTYYFDAPIADDKIEIKKKLQFRYDSLFATSWSAPLTNRRELVLWACHQKNNYMKEHGNEAAVHPCQYPDLIERFGPNYESLKGKLGYLKGLFD